MRLVIIFLTRLKRKFNKNFFFVFIFFSAPLFLLFLPSERNINAKIAQDILKMFNSSKVQKQNYSVLGSGLSRKRSSLLKIELLSEIDSSKKEIIFFSNHQAQYLLKGDNYSNVFNFWIGNYWLTELTDLIYFISDKYDSAIPSKALVVLITSPNNDIGDCIIGYRNELPDEVVGYANIKSSKRNFNFSSKYLIPNGILRSIEFKLDFKRVFENHRFGIIKSNKVSGEFAIDKNGSSTGYRGVSEIPLLFDEEKDFSKPFITDRDINEISEAILALRKLTIKKNIELIIVIPPVYESYIPERLNSNVNIVLDNAILKVLRSDNKVKFIDDRRNEKYLGLDKAKYFYHYDHPSPIYGEELFQRIDSILKKNN